MSISFEEYLRGLNVRTQKETNEVASLRPTLYVGLGGFGCTVIRRLKETIGTLVPSHAGGFAFLGLDTQRYGTADVLTRNEYAELSIGVDPTGAAKQHPDYLAWYSELAGAWKAKSIQAGADETKLVGRLAFRYPPTFQDFMTKLTSAADRLNQFRDNFAVGMPTKVFVISTLAGGTGAGCLLDVMFVVGRFFREAAGTDFPYQAVLATPDILKGEASPAHIPRLYANTYATLKELNHFFVSGDELVVNFDSGALQRTKLSRILLPDPLHLIGDRNESGVAVADKMEQVAEIAISFLVSEIQTPMEDQTGQPKVQDKENMQSDSLGMGGAPRGFSSFGVVRVGLPIEIIEKLFALRLTQHTLTSETAETADMLGDVSNWLDSNGLRERGADQVQDQIKRTAGMLAVSSSLDARGRILSPGFKYLRLVNSCKKLQQDMTKALEEGKKPLIDDAGGRVSQTLSKKLDETLTAFIKDRTVGYALGFVVRLIEEIKSHKTELKQELSSARATLSVREKEVGASIQAVGNAAQGFWGRKGRVENAVSDFGAKLESLLRGCVDVWIKERGDKIYAEVLSACEDFRNRWDRVAASLRGHAARATVLTSDASSLLDKWANVGRRGPGNRFSLVNAAQANQLYEEFVKAEELAATRRIRTRWLESGDIKDTKSTAEQWLDKVTQPVIDHEVRERLGTLNIVSILERFYGDSAAKRKVFDCLHSLSSPLFPLDPNQKEAHYDAYWIVAVHPELRNDFLSSYGSFLPGQGTISAFFGSPFEVILYQLKYGFTLPSHRSLAAYEASFEQLQVEYEKRRALRRVIRPIHCWSEAAEWEDMRPAPEAEEAARWFVLGRAFNYLFPTPGVASPTDRKNVAFLYARGSNYYLPSEGDTKDHLVGRGLTDALARFEDRPDWQQWLRSRIQAQIAEVGEQSVREKLLQVYMPVIKEDIQKAGESSDAQDQERAKVLRRLVGALQKFISDELRAAGV